MSGHPVIAAPPAQPPPPPLRARIVASATHSLRALGLVWRSAPGGVVALAAFTIAASALPPFVAWVGKLIIDAVVAAHAAAPGVARAAALDRAVRLVALELGAVVAMAACERVLGLVRQLVGLRLGIDLNVRILEKAERLSLRHFEDAAFYDKLTRARREASTRPLSLIQSNFQVIRHGLTLAGYVALLIGFSGWMAVAVLAATVPAFIAEARFSGAAFRLRNWRSPDSRRLTYLEYVLGNDEHAKEVKLFGLAPLLLGRYKSLAETFFADDRRLAVRRMAWGYALSLVSTVVFYGCYAVIVGATVRGRLSLGEMTLYLVAFRQGQQSFQAVLTALGGMYEDTLYMTNLFDYFAIPIEDRKSVGPVAVVRAEEGVRFEGVGFKYPGGGGPAQRETDDKWALRSVDVFVPKGQSLALVGENGAGKTTFIKLLAGLYDPTEGACCWTGATCAPGTSASCARASASSSRTSTNTSSRCARTSASAASNTWATTCASTAPSTRAAPRSWSRV